MEENRTITDRNGKREVIEGQFDDPIEVTPKKRKNITDHSVTVVTEPSPDIMLSMYSCLYNSKKAQVTSLVEIPAPFIADPTTLQDQNYDLSQGLEVSSNQSHAASMPSSCNRFPQSFTGGRQMFMPGAAVCMMTLAEPLPKHEKVEKKMQSKEWQIPYSHNYHPRIGFINNPPVSLSSFDSKASSSTTRKESQSAGSKTSKRNNSFPLILEDKYLAFGISDREITNKDVLCGRGGMTNSHPGNVLYRKLVEQQKLRYGTCRKPEKGDIARNIIEHIRKWRGRFLKKRDRNFWYEIGDEMAFQKTSQTLREGLAKMYRNGVEKSDLL